MRQISSSIYLGNVFQVALLAFSWFCQRFVSFGFLVHKFMTFPPGELAKTLENESQRERQKERKNVIDLCVCLSVKKRFTHIIIGTEKPKNIHNFRHPLCVKWGSVKKHQQQLIKQTTENTKIASSETFFPNNNKYLVCIHFKVFCMRQVKQFKYK